MGATNESTEMNGNGVVKFYVSPNGDNGWSGTLSQPNPSRSDGPFATISRARDEVRALKKDGELPAPVTVLMRDGTYFLDEPLMFTPEDSGTQRCPVTYAAYPGEAPVLSGGRRILGWKAVRLEDRELWAAEIPEVKNGQWHFHQLFVDGERRPRTRLPRDGFYYVAGLPEWRPDVPWFESQTCFHYAMGDIKPWSNLPDVEVVALHFWVESRLPVRSVDEEHQLVSFTRRSVFRLTDDHTDRGARYYVENVFEALDTPGQWYLNRSTGTLYYMPLPGEKMETTQVIAPLLAAVVRLAGRPEEGQFVEHLHLEGLTISHNEWWITPERILDGKKPYAGGALQAAHLVPAAIPAEGARSCSISDCTIAHVGTYGIHLGRGCRGCRVAACHMSDLGAGGVKVGETVLREDESEWAGENVVTDCRISCGGQVFHSAAAVWIGHSSHNTVAHNDIHEFYYAGVSVGWAPGYGPSGAHHNRIEYNHIWNIGRGLLSDIGGIYTLGVSPGTVLRGNLIHDVQAHTYGGYGIYLDQGSSHILAEDNVVWRCKHACLEQHYGRDNRIRNNIFALSEQGQISRTRAEPHLSFTLERNIFYWRQGHLLAGNWEGANYHFERNVYFDASGQPVQFGKLPFAEWQRRGTDENSVTADPCFVDPLAGDFRLKTYSPAHMVGFRPIDTSKVGPRRR